MDTVDCPSQGRASEGCPDEPAGQYDGCRELISIEDDQKLSDQENLSSDGDKSNEKEGKGEPHLHGSYLR